MGHLSRGGEPSSAMASMPLPNPKPSTYYAPKMLTPSEEDWLRQNLKETVDLDRQLLSEREQLEAVWRFNKKIRVVVESGDGQAA